MRQTPLGRRPRPKPATPTLSLSLLLSLLPPPLLLPRSPSWNLRQRA